MKTLTLGAAALATSLIGTAAYADCTHNGIAYGTGSLLRMHTTVRICSESGNWVTGDEGKDLFGQTCLWEGKEYSLGAVIEGLTCSRGGGGRGGIWKGEG